MQNMDQNYYARTTDMFKKAINVIPNIANIWLCHKFRKTPSYLPVLIIFISNRCNLKCRMCGVARRDGRTTASRRELSTEEWKRVIDSAERLNSLIVVFAGG